MKSLSRIEVVVGGILILIFLIWSVDRCQSGNKKYQPQEPPQQENTDANTASPDNSTTDTTPAANNTPSTPTPVQVTPTPAPAASPFTVLYVHVEGLKVRDKPFISGSQVLTQLSKNTEVYYLNNKTEYPDKITLEGVEYNEPWVEVQTKDGKYRGWVYGGGVKFYK